LDDLDAFLTQPGLHQPAIGPSAPPLFVLGHSHGGLVVAADGVTRRSLARHDVRGVILSAPYLVNAFPVPRHKAVAARIANVVFPWLRIRSGVEPGMMSSDPDRVDDSRNDPLLLRCATPRWYLTHRAVQGDVLARAGEFSLPLLVLQGDADPIANPDGARAFYSAVGARDKELIVYPGFRHEVLRESGRERVYRDVLGWILNRVAQEARTT
jgi:alpha-beta hydrolase superfamily lysophospholipase